MQVPPEEDRFHDNVGILSEAVHSLVVKAANRGFEVVAPDVVSVAKFFLMSIDKNALIDAFIEKTNRYWERIRLKERVFFLDNTDTMFGDLPVGHVAAFKSLFQHVDAKGHSIVSPDDEDDLWSLFSSQVKISIKYIHRMRGPFSYRSGQSTVNSYRFMFMSSIDIPALSKLWCVNLDYPLDSNATPQALTIQH